jgi:hypothetical protein
MGGCLRDNGDITCVDAYLRRREKVTSRVCYVSAAFLKAPALRSVLP